VTVIGAGRWGTVFARLLAERDHDVVLLCHEPEQAEAIRETGRNPRSPLSVDLRGITAAVLEEAPPDPDVLAVAVPSRSFAEVAANLPASAPVLVLTKGLDPSSGRRLSTLAGERPAAVLSGPNFAEEIAARLPAAAVVASDDLRLAERLQGEIASLDFRVYVNADVVGVELCAAAKNVIAVAAGAVDGLGLGDNAKAALVTRGLAEVGRLVGASGGRAETVAGLAGMGDLMATCWSRHGRNRRAGELIAQGVAPNVAVARIGTVEGAATAPALWELGRTLGVELPVTESVCRVLGGEPPSELVSSLMGRPPTVE
jgi:glycerol-3-phosphate dehydrogenase (NAD(P)+)